MNFTLGVYSQLPSGTSSAVMERLLSASLTPLLQHLYWNPSDSVLLCLSGFEMEWFEANHPEINVLINNLARRGQIEFLTTSFDGVCLDLLPPQDRPAEIEKTTNYIRRRYSKKAIGLWVYQQVFSTSYIPLAELCSLKYIVISAPGHKDPFIMTEVGKSAVIVPTNDDLSKLIADADSHKLSTDAVLSKISTLKIEREKLCDTVFINMDQLLYEGVNGFAVITAVIDKYKSRKYLSKPATLSDLCDNCVIGNGYLTSGITGYDLNTQYRGVQEIIVNNPVYSTCYQLLMRLKTLAKNSSADKTTKKEINNAVVHSLCSYPYLFYRKANGSKNIMHKGLFEAARILFRSAVPVPCEIDVDGDMKPEFVWFSKHYCCVFDSKGANFPLLSCDSGKNALLTDSPARPFSDSLTSAQLGTVNLSRLRFETVYDAKKFFPVSGTVRFSGLSLTKSFDFDEKNGKLECAFEFGNTSDGVQTLEYSICVPVSGEFADGRIVLENEQHTVIRVESDGRTKIAEIVSEAENKYTEINFTWGFEVQPRSEKTIKLVFKTNADTEE